MRIGLLGGTFDPVHNGHLFLAEKVLEKLSLDKVIFIPAHLPPHKSKADIILSRHRYNMVKSAIQGNKKFQVSDIEIKRKGKSYSARTLKELRRKYGPEAEIFFITGSDSLAELDKWKDLAEIMRLCRFVVVKRPCFPIKNADLRDFIVLRIGAKDVSATEIRRRSMNRQAITGLVPDSVRRYVEKRKLYICRKNV